MARPGRDAGAVEGVLIRDFDVSVRRRGGLFLDCDILERAPLVRAAILSGDRLLFSGSETERGESKSVSSPLSILSPFGRSTISSSTIGPSPSSFSASFPPISDFRAVAEEIREAFLLGKRLLGADRDILLLEGAGWAILDDALDDVAVAVLLEFCVRLWTIALGEEAGLALFCCCWRGDFIGDDLLGDLGGDERYRGEVATRVDCGLVDLGDETAAVAFVFVFPLALAGEPLLGD